MTVNFDDQAAAWSSPPVDDVGYLPSAEMLTYRAAKLRKLVDKFETARYQGHRNAGGAWRQALGLDSTHGRTVLDYGCGVGVEALQYAKAGNDVWVADIAPDNVALALRVLNLYGYKAHGLNITGQWPFIDTEETFDVIHCCGVLHHIPNPRPVVQRMAELLVPNGELRLMLYSDRSWLDVTQTAPPEDVATHQAFQHFVHRMDTVGAWADWYDEGRLERRFGDILTVERVQYLMNDKTFLTATLRKQESPDVRHNRLIGASIEHALKQTGVKWTIAVLTVPERKKDFNRLIKVLTSQIGDLNIEILVADQDWGIGRKRQWCLDNAKGEYFNFCDDDDMVADDYVNSIYPLLDGVDYVGFRLQLYWDGEARKPTFHSLRYDGWSEDEHGAYRDVSHLNPMKTEIARQGDFVGDWGEDKAWSEQVEPETEHYINRVMYHYYFSPRLSLAVRNKDAQ